MIGAIHQRDARVWMAQMFAEGKPPETSPQDNDMPRVLARHAQTVGEGSRCVKAAQCEPTKKASSCWPCCRPQQNVKPSDFGSAPADYVTCRSGRRSDVDCPVSWRWFHYDAFARVRNATRQPKAG